MPIADALRAAGPFPVSLVGLLAREADASPNAALDRLRLKFGIGSAQDAVGAERGAAPESLAWHRLVQIEDYPAPILVAAVRGAPDVPAAARADFPPAIEGGSSHGDDPLTATRSHLIVQTLLPAASAQAAYGFLLQATALLAGDGLVALWDAEAQRLRAPDELFDLTSSKAPPGIGELYTLDRFRLDDAPSADRLAVATRGLLRAGLPELQVLFVGAEDEALAASLVASVAGQWITTGVPEPGEVFGLLGAPTRLVWSEAASVAAFAVGGGAGGPAAVLFPPEAVADSSPRTVATITRAVDSLLAAVRAEGLASYSPFESRIQETQARERLGSFTTLWTAADGAADLEFRIKLGFDVDLAIAGEGAPPGEGAPNGAHNGGRHADAAPHIVPPATPRQPAREHLWFRVLDLSEGAFQCELLNEPRTLRDRHAGDIEWFTAERVSDWAVAEDGDTVHTPRTLRTVRALIRRLGGPRPTT